MKMRVLSFAGKTVFKVMIALLLSYQTVVGKHGGYGLGFHLFFISS